MTEVEQPEDQEDQFAVQVAVVVIMVALAIIGVVVFLQVQVCDEQLTDEGDVVEVCRSMALSDFPMVIIGLALVSLLGYFFSEISGFGFTFKRAISEAKQSADKAKDAADGAKEAVFGLRNEVNLVQRQIAQQNVNVNLFGPTEETTFELREVWPLASLAQEMETELRQGAEYVVGRTTYGIPPEFITASEIATRLVSGEKVVQSEIDALKVSIRETARKYEHRLSDRVQGLLVASGAVADAPGAP